MYLRRLTINGFKSFASKTTLEFEPGITAIVGPNGSGKSNVADAIRWALGEQSTKTLRSKKSDELVFAGTDKRAKASLAQVDLLLDNSDGGMAIDFSEVELSRLLYRSGESEYKLNGRKVRLLEVQHLLAQAGFGQNSYTIIGQGMIDAFILSTPAERKLLFDEASGIRQYEIKREQALKKLDATTDNLSRAADIVAELAPRLKTLERSVAADQERSQLSQQLKSNRAHYLASAEQEYADQDQRLLKQQGELRQEIAAAEKVTAELEERRQQIAEPASEGNPHQATHLHDLEVERDKLTNDVSVKKAEMQFLIEKRDELKVVQTRVEAQEAELDRLLQAQQKLGSKLKTAQAGEATASQGLDKMAERIRLAQSRLSALRQDIQDTSNGEFISHALSILRHIAKSPELTGEQMRDLVSRAGRLLLNASFGQGNLTQEVRQAQQNLVAALKQREKAHDSYTSAVIKVRSLELDLANNLAVQAGITEQLDALRKQAAEVDRTSQLITDRREYINQAEERLVHIEAEIIQKRAEVTASHATIKTDDIFALAAELEAARYRRQQAAERLAGLAAELNQLAGLRSALASQAKAWNIVASGATKTPLAEQERNLAVLEGRIGAEPEASAAEEYQEVKERHQFLTVQIDDLEAAKADLQSVIEQLDKLIKTKFEASFATIAKHFSAYFVRLFGGGTAGLALKPDADGIYGIEIKAVPPGKRVESLTTLSGGERALTGIALLAAILATNPSPFVVLDEIDAALDEANSGRLSTILRDVAKHSQLLVITHNRSVMQAANAIYGVTMDDHHVSKLLSIKLDDAKELAAT